MSKVSVVIPVFKAEQFIAATIQSVLDQTYADFEIIIVDDGSPDNSIQICQQFTDPRIKIIRQENRGVAVARNAGIQQAQGDYIALLDADDLWHPEKLEKHVAHLDSSPQVGVSFSRSAFIDEQGQPLNLYQMSKLQEITPLDLICRTPIGNGSAPVMRRQVFEAIKFQEEQNGVLTDFYFNADRDLHPSEDVECWLRIALQTQWLIEGLPEALTLYRVNPNGFSAQLIKKLNSWRTMLDKLRIYAPEQAAQWENIAMAYQYRHLARRAVTLKIGSTAIAFSLKALSLHWRILLEEPRRTLLTLGASCFLWALPQPLYQRIEATALKVTGANQKRRILQDQVSQPA